MNELLFGNIIEKESLENILAYNQIKKCDNEINKYTEEIEEQREEMKHILQNENVDDEFVDKIQKYKSVLKTMSGDNTRVSELDEMIEKNENRIQEFQSKIALTEEEMQSIKEVIYNTENPSEIIDCQNQLENLNVRLNDLNDILNQLISDNTPLLIEREYLYAKNGDVELNVPKYDKEEIKKQLEFLEKEFDSVIEGLALPVRENIEFCQKKIKNRELEIEKFNARKENVINNFPNAIKVDIKGEYKNIESLLYELDLKMLTEEDIAATNFFEDVVVEETEEIPEEIPEEINDFANDMVDEMGDLDFEEEKTDEEVVEEPVIEEKKEQIETTVVEESVAEEPVVEEKEEVVETTQEVKEEKVEETVADEVASVSYVLSDGESLANIAEKVYPSKENWLAIYYFNKDAIDKYLVSNGISNDMETITELSTDTNLFTGIKLEIPTDYNYKI